MRNNIVRLIEKCASGSLLYAESSCYGTGCASSLSQPRKVKLVRRRHRKKYEVEKRCRSFQNSWMSTFPWLIHEGSTMEPTESGQSAGVMKCKNCKYSSKGVAPRNFFVTGSTNFKYFTFVVYVDFYH
jgi:hypothetical protein